MSSDERLRALERRGDRQGYLRECWRVGGVAMFEAALRPGDEVEVDAFFADRRPTATIPPGTPVHVVRREVMAPEHEGPTVRGDCEWRVLQDNGPEWPRGPDWLVSWLRPRGAL